MAANSEPVEGVVCVQAVFTPPERRNRGYAGACVSDLSGLMREGGYRCMLYTDLGNPTSNSLYRRIGYRAVAEGLRYLFE
jgi:predicted GNAT family acetyltransferase